MSRYNPDKESKDRIGRIESRVSRRALSRQEYRNRTIKSE
jgi:hypothetical protein